MTDAPASRQLSAAAGNILASEHRLKAAGGYSALSAFALANSMLWNSVHPFLLPILVFALVADADGPNTWIGIITFIGLVVAMIIQPIAGALSDAAKSRWGRRRPFIVGGIVGTILLVAAMSQANSLVMLLAVYVILQMVFNFALGPYQGLIPDLVPENRRGSAAGFKAFAEVAGILIPALAIVLFLTENDVFVWFMAIIAILAIGTGITVLVIREDPNPTDRPAMDAMESVRSAFRISPRRHADFFWMLLGRLLFVVAMTSIQQFSFSYVRDVLQPEEVLIAAGLLTLIIAVCILAVTYPAGLLSDRFGRRSIILIAGAFGAVGAFLIPMAGDMMGVYIFGSLVGIGVGLFLSSNWALATDLIPSGQGARFLGLTNLATAGGAALARLNGPMIDAVNEIEPLLGYQVWLWLIAALFAGGGLLVLLVRPPGKRETAPRQVT